MDKELIKAEIEKQGHTVREFTVLKNGCNLLAWNIDYNKSNYSIVPNIYIDMLLNELPECISKKATADFIIDFHNQHLLADINIKEMLKPENILKGVYIALQQKSEEDILKKDCQFDDLEQYLIYSYRDEYHIKLNKQTINGMELDEEELWKNAYENTAKNIEFISFKELATRLPENDDRRAILGNDLCPAYALTNKLNYKGAGSILCKKELGEYAKAYGLDRVAAIPSNINEWILVDIYQDGIDLDELTDILKEVNDTQVDEAERLSYKVYIIDLRG